MDERLYQQFFDAEEWFWWSVGSRQACYAALAGLALAGRRVVDVGCGTGIALRELPFDPGLRCGCDLSPTALRLARRRGLPDLVRSDATRLPFAADRVDLVLALDVIEHLDDDLAALREIARILAPGGHALIHVPTFPILWTDKDVLNHHRRRYRRRALLALVERAGLMPRRTAYLNATLLPGALARALWQRLVRRDRGGEAVLGLYDPPRLLNRGLLAVLRAEARVGRWLPFGMSLVCLAEKPATARARS